MDIKTNPFYELRNRLYASAAAGSALIAEDFRLQRAIEAFKPMSEANKVFGRLYDMCSALITSDDPSSGIADCIALADALAVTQGTFSDDSETSPAKALDSLKPVHLPYTQLCEYRKMIRKTAHSRQSFGEDFLSAARDPRLLVAYLSVSGVNSIYVDELSVIFEAVYGEALVQPLVDSIDISDPKTTGQQIKYIRRIAGANQNQLYVSLAENEENPQGVRIAAIEAMACSNENDDILLTLYKTGKGKVKNAALMSLARINSPNAEEPIRKLLEKYKPANMAFAAASGGQAATEYTKAAVDYVINNKVSFDDKEHPNIFVVEGLLANKKDVTDCFLKLGEHLAKDYTPSRDGSDFMTLNQSLISNLYNHPDAEYRDMIKYLYHKLPEVFFSARFYLELTCNPMRACGIMDCDPKKYARIMLRYLGNVFTSPDGWYRLPCTTASSEHTAENVRLFTSVPDDMLRFLSDTSEIRKPSLLHKLFPLGYDRDIINANINGRCTVLEKLLRICTPADRERVKQAAEKLAWAMNEACPNEKSVNILGGCTDRPLDGIIQNYVTYTLLNTMHRASGYVLEGLKVPEELLISELKALIKNLPSLSSKVEKVKLSAQINDISRILSKHGIIY